ncbi:MAG: helix-turn-helix transcriptional regulator [Rhodanobacteraceae bacterium]|nr:helix-turn-helix transcriptional regulator [Rhodanobacteraceae bacterium]
MPFAVALWLLAGRVPCRCRLERALHMLQRADSSLTAIAAACGYADHSHFTHAFRRRYGCTPSTFRARSGAYLPA